MFCERHMHSLECCHYFLNVCPFDCTAFAVSGKVGIPLNKLFDHTSWVAVVSPTDRPKSVHNFYVIEVGCVFVLSRCFFIFLRKKGLFVIGLSQIQSFLSFLILFSMI